MRVIINLLSWTYKYSRQVQLQEHSKSNQELARLTFLILCSVQLSSRRWVLENADMMCSILSLRSFPNVAFELHSILSLSFRSFPSVAFELHSILSLRSFPNVAFELHSILSFRSPPPPPPPPPTPYCLWFWSSSSVSQVDMALSHSLPLEDHQALPPFLSTPLSPRHLWCDALGFVPTRFDSNSSTLHFRSNEIYASCLRWLLCLSLGPC